jgi:ferredoxin-NADP reductase
VEGAQPGSQPLTAALPGQYIVLRLRPTKGGPPLFRSYSLSGAISTELYRISVKVEPNGAAGTYLHERVRVGDVIEASSPRGSFVLQRDERPVVLLSAGIGATPVLAMLHALAAARSTRPVLWLHAARDRWHHPFPDEVRRLMGALPHGRLYDCYSKPGSGDRMGEDLGATGRLSRSVFDAVGIPKQTDVYLCRPARFMSDMKAALAGFGVAPKRTYAEIFGGSEVFNPSIVGAAARAPHLPEDGADTGPLASFARSGIAVHWRSSRYLSILELAESVRRARLLVVPDRRFPQLQKWPGFRRRHPRSPTARRTRRWQTSRLLLTTNGRPCRRFVKARRDEHKGAYRS